MILLVGLGNPGTKYEKNRHNIGFRAVEAIADSHGFGPPRRRFQGFAMEGLLGGEKALILKPQTFMNLSGQAVGEAMRFYKLRPADIVVFHDELDLAPGKLRVKTGGGHAGHNGLKSVTQHIGADFRRVRIGIGHPGDKARVPGYVLHDFPRGADPDWIRPLLDAVSAAAPALVDTEEAFRAMVHNHLNRKLAQSSQQTREGKPDSEPVKEKKESNVSSPFASLGRLFQTFPERKN